MLQRTKPLLGSVRVSETPDDPRGQTWGRTDAVLCLGRPRSRRLPLQAAAHLLPSSKRR